MLLPPKFRNQTLLLQCLSTMISFYMKTYNYVSIIGPFDLKNVPVVRMDLSKSFHNQMWQHPTGGVIIADLSFGRSMGSREIYMKLFMDASRDQKIIFIGSRYVREEVTLTAIHLGHKDIIHLPPKSLRYSVITYWIRKKRRITISEVGSNFAKKQVCLNGMKENVDIFKKSFGNLRQVIYNMCFMCETCKNEIEIEIFKTITDHLGMILVTDEFKWNTTNKDNLSKNVYNCDILFGNIDLIQENFLLATVPYIYDTISWYVPARKMSFAMSFPIKIFSIENWIMIIITTIAISIAWIFINFNKQNERLSIFFVEKISIIILEFLEQSRNTKKRSIAEKIVVVLVIQYAFLLNAIYKCKFINYLTFEEYNNPIISYEDIIESGIEIAIPNWEILTPMRKNFQFSSKYCGHSLNCLEKNVLRNGEAVLALDRIARRHWIELNEKNDVRIKKLNPVFIGKSVSSLSVASNPLLNLVNKYLTFMINTGLTKKIISKYDNKYKIKDVALGNIKLNIKHIATPVIILATGIIFSFFVLIIEIAFKRFH